MTNRGFATGRWRPALAGGAVVVLVTQWVVIAGRRVDRGGDFDVIRELGRRWAGGHDLYDGGLAFMYLPTAGMLAAPLALLPPHVGFIVRYAIALAALYVTLRLLIAMRSGVESIVRQDAFGCAALTIVLGAHYILRDLDDAGPHLIYLTVVVGAIWAASVGKRAWAATWFGLAAALKPPLGLFLPFLVWKRQWRLAMLAVAATAVWILLPAVWMGPAGWWRQHATWVQAVAQSPGDLPRLVQNQSVWRVARHYTGDEIGTDEVAGGPVPDPTVPRPSVPTLAFMLAGAAIAGTGFTTRRRVETRDARWLPEASAVLLLALLLSPITWIQHMVFAIPALFLVAVEVRRARGPGPWTTAGLVAFVILALVLNRELLGRERYLWLLARGSHAVALTILLAVVLTCRARPDHSGRLSPPSTTSV